MKKYLICLIMSCILIVSATNAFAAKFSVDVSDDLNVDMSETYVNGEHTMIPLRTTAENFGYEVIWNDEEKSIVIANDNVSTKIYIGKDSYYIEELNDFETNGLEMSNPVMVGAAPELKDSKTYVPAIMFNMLSHYNDVAAAKLIEPTTQTSVPMGKISFAVTDNMKLDMSETYVLGEHTMVPVLKTAENLGYTAVWNEEDKSIFIDNGKVSTKIQIGADNYFVEVLNGEGMANPVILGAAPEIKDNVIYAPAAMFNLLGRYLIMQK